MANNPELDLAWDFVEKTDRSIFLTGKAGTGKTTFLHSLRANSLKRLIVVAPTGVAAINAKGVTIHSFFQMPFGPILPEGSSFKKSESFKHKFSKLKINIIRSLDLLIIDEISMVRADLLDGIDQVLRRYRDRNKVFGGVQVLMIGDLQQLSPVVKDYEWQLLAPHYKTPFFFSSQAFIKANAISIELKHIYRQDNEKFIKILNEIRNNNLSEASAKELNKRYLPDFSPKKKDGYITLTTHNNRANTMNEEQLKKLKGKKKIYKAEIEGKFVESSFPTHEILELKVGAQVMFIKNDSDSEKRYFNGKIGKIISLSKQEIQVKCPEDDDEITVTPETWENVNYTLNPKTKEISENIIGTFTQMPLRLAWAITIHKSQGLTFDKAIIDANAAFAHGQTYVALSRCRTLEGVVLKSKINSGNIITDTRVTAFNKNISEKQPDKSVLNQSKKRYQLNLVEELLNFYQMMYPIDRMIDVFHKNQNSFQGNIIDPLTELKEKGVQPILKIATGFKKQLQNLTQELDTLENNEEVKDRIYKAIQYFLEHAKSKIKSPFDTISFSTEDKTLYNDFEKNYTSVEEQIAIKLFCLNGLKEQFSTQKYLKLKAEAILKNESIPKKRKEFVAETEHPILFNLLRDFRGVIAQTEDIPHFQVFTQRTLYDLSNLLPLNKKELKTIHGMGKVRIEKYGEEILAIINEYADEHNVVIKEFVIKKKKPKVGNSKLVSLEMHKQGMSISEIATKREMVTSTIEGHLISFIPTGEVSVFDIVSEEKFTELEKEIKNKKFESLGDLKHQLDNKFTYPEIKLVLSLLEKDT